MTYRERKEAKAERLREWAVKRNAKAIAASDKMHTIMDGIPLGQPILVGHHSEAHARRDQARIESNMSAIVENTRTAEAFESRADNIEKALDRSIYSDDDNAIAALETRIAQHERERDHMKNINNLFRKGDVAGLAALGLDYGTLHAKVSRAYSWEKSPYPGWALTNLSARIRTDKERMETIKAQSARHEQAEASGGVTVEGAEWVRVTFAEKPERTVIDALKAAGFYWHGGSWNGQRAKMPATIQ